MLTILFVILYLVCYIFTYGLVFARVQKKEPAYLAKIDYKNDMICSMVISLSTPIVLVVLIIIAMVRLESPFKDGLKFW